MISDNKCKICNNILNSDNWFGPIFANNYSVCVPCNKERNRNKSAKYRKNNKEKVIESNRRSMEKHKESRTVKRKEHYAINKDLFNRRKCINRLKLRYETMLAYGNKCINCEEDKILFLTLDHINNNGILDRKNGIGAGIEFYSFLKRKGYPGMSTQLQILCHNCNAVKEYDDRASKFKQYRSTTQEVYIQQEYSISKELDDELWQKARDLYEKLSK